MSARLSNNFHSIEIVVDGFVAMGARLYFPPMDASELGATISEMGQQLIRNDGIREPTASPSAGKKPV